MEDHCFAVINNPNLCWRYLTYYVHIRYDHNIYFLITLLYHNTFPRFQIHKDRLAHHNDYKPLYTICPLSPYASHALRSNVLPLYPSLPFYATWSRTRRQPYISVRKPLLALIEWVKNNYKKIKISGEISICSFDFGKNWIKFVIF
jgi:hypothetical protein